MRNGRWERLESYARLMQGRSPLTSLPDDVLERIFVFLPERDLRRLGIALLGEEELAAQLTRPRAYASWERSLVCMLQAKASYSAFVHKVGTLSNRMLFFARDACSIGICINRAAFARAPPSVASSIFWEIEPPARQLPPYPHVNLYHDVLQFAFAKGLSERLPGVRLSSHFIPWTDVSHVGPCMFTELCFMFPHYVANYPLRALSYTIYAIARYPTEMRS